MPPRTSLLTNRKALSILRQPYASPIYISGNHGPASANSHRSIATAAIPNNSASRLNSSYGVGVGLTSSPSGRVTQRRLNSSKSDGKDQSPGKGETVQHHDHHLTPEEGARIEEDIKKAEGTPGTPEQEQGSFISEILNRDNKAKEYAPKVMQEQMKKGPGGSRSFSTSTRLRQEELQQNGQQQSPDDITADMLVNMISQATDLKAEQLQEPGLKFQAPRVPLPKTENFRSRYDALLEQFTKLLMQDGKLSRAQKNMSFILDHLRTAPPPQPNPKRRLLPAPPAPQLPLNPALYLALAVDSVAPLVKIRQQKGIAGGGAALQIPVPLSERQRRRTAIRWIIDASDKRRDSKFALRVANELIAVAEGRSGVWDRREQVHKIGVAGRSNLGSFARR